MLEQTAHIKGGVAKVIRAVKKERKKADKAMNAAVRGAAYKMRKKLKREIRAGDPGGSPFKPLSFIALRMKKKRRSHAKPLTYLASGIRYHVRSKAPYEVGLGWVAPGTSAARASKIFQKIAERSQQETTTVISNALRKKIIARGAELGKSESGGTPFFLRKATKEFKTPQRKIIEPFFRRNKMKIEKLIQKNFKLKMAGKRFK